MIDELLGEVTGRTSGRGDFQERVVGLPGDTRVIRFYRKGWKTGNRTRRGRGGRTWFLYTCDAAGERKGVRLAGGRLSRDRDV